MSEAMELDGAVTRPHDSPVLREFLNLSIEQIDAILRLKGNGMRFVSSEPER